MSCHDFAVAAHVFGRKRWGTNEQGTHLLPMFAISVWFSVSVGVSMVRFSTIPLLFLHSGSQGQEATIIFTIQDRIAGLQEKPENHILSSHEDCWPLLGHWTTGLDSKAKPKSATSRERQVRTANSCLSKNCLTDFNFHFSQPVPDSQVISWPRSNLLPGFTPMPNCCLTSQPCGEDEKSRGSAFSETVFLPHICLFISLKI